MFGQTCTVWKSLNIIVVTALWLFGFGFTFVSVKAHVGKYFKYRSVFVEHHVVSLNGNVNYVYDTKV